jgi:hypothetical protein
MSKIWWSRRRQSARGSLVPPLALVAVLSMGAQAAAQEDFYPVRTNWTDYWEGDLNISVFVFRDSNRNGLYDLGDRPMSGIRVDAAGHGREIWTTSNAAGFANFKMSGTLSDADIIFAGPYDFTVRTPRNWSVSTGNETQTSQFAEKPGAPADMVAIPVPALVGLAPDLSISGELEARGEGRLLGPDGEEHEFASGHFSIEAETGEWRSPDTQSMVTVTNVPVQLAAEWWNTPSIDANTTVTFDDLQGEGVLKIPSGYKGLGWENMVMTHQKFYEPEGYRNGVMSGEFLAYNGSGHPAAISSAEPFAFVGGYFGISTLEAEGETLRIRGWRGDKEMFEEDMTLSALGPTYLAANWKDLTRLEFTTAHYWQFTADDLLFALPGR